MARGVAGVCPLVAMMFAGTLLGEDRCEFAGTDEALGFALIAASYCGVCGIA